MDGDFMKFIEQLASQAGGSGEEGVIAPGGTAEGDGDMSGIDMLIRAMMKTGGLKDILGGGQGGSSGGSGSFLGGLSSGMFGGQ